MYSFSFRVQINEELSATGVIAQFTILSTHRNDGGSYTCSAKNQFGEVNNTIILRIVGKFSFIIIINVIIYNNVDYDYL